MRFGVSTGAQRVSWAAVLDLALRLDRLDLDTFWLFDHLLPLGGDVADPVLETWAIMGAIAQATERVRLGTLVTANTFRAPALLAKMAATVDHISGGRLTVGLGAGYYPAEHEAYGLDFPDRARRAAMLDESCQVLKGLWGGERRFSFEGRHYRIVDAPFAPAAVQPGGPPLLVGGAGERYTFETVARYADQWNLPDGTNGITPEHFARKWAVLRQRCAEVGRDPATLETNAAVFAILDAKHARALERRRQFAAAQGMPEARISAGDPSAFAEEVRAFEEAGVDHFVITVLAGVNDDSVELFAERVVSAWR